MASSSGIPFVPDGAFLVLIAAPQNHFHNLSCQHIRFMIKGFFVVVFLCF